MSKKNFFRKSKKKIGENSEKTEFKSEKTQFKTEKLQINQRIDIFSADES